MRSRLPAELVLFGLVGVLNTVFSLLAYGAVLDLGAAYLLAAPIAFAVGALNGYLLNARFTFRRPRSRGSLLRYIAAQLAAAGAADVLLWLLVTATRQRLAAYAATLAVASTASFVTSRRWVFALR
jgi:putative flippase GtrA